MQLYRTSEQLAIALESYGGVERVSGGNTDAPEEAFGTNNQYRLGPIVYCTFGSDDDVASAVGKSESDESKRVETTIGAGALFGLNGDTPATTLKLSLDVDF